MFRSTGAKESPVWEWRLIVDLSHPKGASVNDGVEPELCSMKYMSVDEAVSDIESAYRTVPVHPEDRWLLGMKWRGKLYVDKALPFGLRSAPKIYNAVADAMQWILGKEGVEVIHYQDDFLMAGAPNSSQCGHALRTSHEWCRRLGVPVSPHKMEGLVTRLVFLGIELNTVQLSLHLPDCKLRRLQREIQRWSGRKTCSKCPS